ncbi:uncharacterized protein [Mytilus edulis]|uniref:uncharacterized protein n=1 Tax=Mytilus edulis TaxID=6550 RepID=UPI0039F07F36
MATTAMQRPATVSFGGDIVLDRRRGSRSYSIQHDRRDSYDQLRRQSIKYQFPNPILEAEIKGSDLPEVNEDDIRKHVFGKPVSEMTFIGLDTSVRRPTVSSARHSVIWARDRKLYEERNKFDVEEFRNQPYMKHEYPSLRKHYPGTWKLATRDQIDETTDRLSHTPAPTAASLHLHKYHSYLYRKLHESDHIPNSSYRRRPKTSVF